MKTKIMFLLVAILFSFGCTNLVGQRGFPAINGISNFDKVDNNLYRGAQPNHLGIEFLKSVGIKTIVNLRMNNDIFVAEEDIASSCGIVYVSIPLDGIRRPTKEQINNVLNIINSSPKPVYVHCAHGCDRTGTVIACYRIKYYKWTTDKALKEAIEYGISPLELGMRDFIEDFEISK